MRKSILSVSDPTVLLMGLVGSRHLCTILVTTGVSLPAFTRMFLAFLIDVVLSIAFVRAQEGQSCLPSVLVLLDVTAGPLWSWWVLICTGSLL